jgi:TonB family protein
MKPPRRLAIACVAALALAGAPHLAAQDEPVAAGSEGVSVPKKTKHIQPAYPQEALAQGVRGIVILDLVLDAQGKVESTSVIRSVPGLDEAAIAAARQWEYEPTKVDGKPVRVRLTVPITFALALPKLERQTGVPDLRQGANPVWPAGATGGGLVTAEVTLEPDGRVGVARVLEGGAPWAASLLGALRTWRFSPPPDDEVLSFRVEAEFVGSRGSEPPRVDLRASGVQRSGLLSEQPLPPPAPATPAPAPAAPPAPAPAPATPAPTAATSSAEAPAAVSPDAPATPAPTVPVPVPPPPSVAASDSRVPEAAPPAMATPPAAQVAAKEGPALPPPAEEVITAPPPALPPENGVSAIRDVTLEPGVPDLAKGRRPVTPPLARMTGAMGRVEVSFSVGASGATSVQTTSGPELLRPAAEQAVVSWVFRRTRADRAYLIAIFDYTGDKGAAVVRPHAAPATPPVPASPAPASPAPTRP